MGVTEVGRWGTEKHDKYYPDREGTKNIHIFIKNNAGQGINHCNAVRHQSRALRPLQRLKNKTKTYKANTPFVSRQL